MTGNDVVEMLSANYFAAEDFALRASTDASGFARIMVLVTRAGKRTRLFGLRLVDYPTSPPTLRFWRTDRWDSQDFDFDFTAAGDLGSGTVDNRGIATMCIPYHVDYYKERWHTDKPWIAAQADLLVADLVVNILRRS